MVIAEISVFKDMPESFLIFQILELKSIKGEVKFNSSGSTGVNFGNSLISTELLLYNVVER